MASLRGCHFSRSWSNTKKKNKSPMFFSVLFHEVMINKSICDRFYFGYCYSVK